MRRLTTLLIAFNLIGCGSGPDTDLCVINVPGLLQRCYNLKKDYDSDGKRKKNAMPLIKRYNSKEEMLDALNKNFTTDSKGFENLKIYIKNARETCW